MTSAKFLGPYRVGELIGRGGMGSVYDAVHETSGERVAVKLIASHVSDEMRFRQRFAAEVETLKRLRHPNIVRLIGYGEEDGQLFYSMELVTGESLQKVLRREKKLSWVHVVDISIQVCAALKHAHDFGVIHRDLKPANLIIANDGGVKLVDFGIAKLFGFGEQTMVGSVLGTADYMAPEQADGIAITPRTDLYALGSVMYAMLASRAPFADKNMTRVMQSLKHERPVSLALVDREIPIEVVELVDHLLEKCPEDRPPTALAVGNRLKALKSGLLRDRTAPDQAGATQISDPKKIGDSDSDSPTTSSGIDDADGTSLSSDSDHGHDLINNGTGAAAPGVSSPAASEARPTGDTFRSQRQATPSPDHRAGPADLTMASDKKQTIRPTSTKHAEQDASDDETVLETKTHFRTVDENSRHEYLGQHSQPAHPISRILQSLSIAAMVAILIGGTYLFWRSIQIPDANELYATIVAADQADQLSNVEPSMRLFLDEYPGDARVDVISSLQDKLELDRLLKRLKLKSRIADGLENLPPHEQAFYRAMTNRNKSPIESSEQLRDWLTVFHQPGEAVSMQIESMARLARAELARLAGQSPLSEVDPRVSDLMMMMDQGDSQPTADYQKKLQSIIDLHQDLDWAKPAVNRASKLLEASRVTTAETAELMQQSEG